MNDIDARVYGAVARIGLIVPSTNTVCETEFWRMAPAGVTIHTSRMPFLPERFDHPFEEMERHLPRVLEEANSAAPDTIAYACTASSAKGRPEAMEAELSSDAARPTVTAAAALVAAIRHFGAERIALVTPYPPALNAKECKFFRENDIEVAAEESVIVDEAQLSLKNMRLVPTDALVERAVALGARDDVDAVVLSCSDMPTLDAIPRIESAIGKPAISSAQSLFWRTLRRAGINDAIHGCGRLLADTAEA